MKKIIVYCEKNPDTKEITSTSYELLSKARELKEKARRISPAKDYMVEAVLISNAISDEFVNRTFGVGADSFTLIKGDNLGEFCQTIYASVFLEYFNTIDCEIILFPATPTGRIVAPRITTALNTGLVADCTEIDMIENKGEVKLAATRPTFGSELMATILSKTMPQCATVRPGTFEEKIIANIDTSYKEFPVTTYEEARIKLLGSIIEKSHNVSDIENAKIILCAGYGLATGGKEYYEKLEKLALITNSKYAVTRKVVDYKLASSENQIGQTGKTVKPELYISFGVSGSIQHIAGMKNSKKIIAINSDKNAEIFKYADYKIIADAKQVIDDLLNCLK